MKRISNHDLLRNDLLIFEFEKKLIAIWHSKFSLQRNSGATVTSMLYFKSNPVNMVTVFTIK